MRGTQIESVTSERHKWRERCKKGEETPTNEHTLLLPYATYPHKTHIHTHAYTHAYMHTRTCTQHTSSYSTKPHTARTLQHLQLRRNESCSPIVAAVLQYSQAHRTKSQRPHSPTNVVNKLSPSLPPTPPPPVLRNGIIPAGSSILNRGDRPYRHLLLR